MAKHRVRISHSDTLVSGGISYIQDGKRTKAKSVRQGMWILEGDTWRVLDAEEDNGTPSNEAQITANERLGGS